MEGSGVRVSLWGVVAYLLLYAGVVTGIGLSSAALRLRVPAAGRAGRLHEVLSLAALFAAFVHTAVSVLTPQGIHWRWLVFADTGGPPGPGIAAGVGALYAAAAAAAAFYLRRRLGAGLWRVVHTLAYPALALGIWHGVALGANAWLPALRTLYLITGATAAALAVVRVAQYAGLAGKPVL
jgi:sulfoxide reductase heme-binding subunit YedZ